MYKLSQNSHTLFTSKTTHTWIIRCLDTLIGKMSTTTSTAPDTFYDVQERDILVSSKTRYQVIKFTGEGYFGTVAKCLNLMTGEPVALKIHKDDEGYFIRNELEMLKEISALDPDKSNIVTFFEGFRFHNLSCMTFEMLDKSLLDVMREQKRTMHLNEIRPITHQLLVAFEALKSIGIVHLDVKPDNILFMNHKDHPFKLKLIDFGLAQRVSEVQAEMIIQPFSYQALEVGLGLPLSEAMDMWGVGCVMAFMYFGTNLLPYHCPYDWMRTIVHLLGQPQDRLLDAGEHTSTYFIKKDDSPGWRLKSSDEYFETTGVQTRIRRKIFDYAKDLDDAVWSYPEDRGDVEHKDRMAFLSLLKSCLDPDPETRATPREAIMNPFISMVHLVDVMATSTHAEEALQIMYDSHLNHLVESDSVLSDSDTDYDYFPLSLAGEDSDIKSYGEVDMDAEDWRSDDQLAEGKSSDTHSCIVEDGLSDYDADCRDTGSTDPHISADNANAQNSSDEDVIQPSSLRCSESLPLTDDKIVQVYDSASGGDSLPTTLPTSGQQDISTNDEATADISTKNEASADISTNDEASADISTKNEASADISTKNEASADISTKNEAGGTQPAVQQKKFRKIRKFFSRIRRRVVSFFTN